MLGNVVGQTETVPCGRSCGGLTRLQSDKIEVQPLSQQLQPRSLAVVRLVADAKPPSLCASAATVCAPGRSRGANSSDTAEILAPRSMSCALEIDPFFL
jgi:hypothetical protein